MKHRHFIAAFAAVALLLPAAGCSRQAPPTENETPSSTGSSSLHTTITTSTTTIATTSSGATRKASGTTSTAAEKAQETKAPSIDAAAASSVPAARDILGMSYGELLSLMDNTYYVINQRGHDDVACCLVNTQKLPYYEILDADSAFKDWSYGVSLIGTDQPGDASAIQTSGTVTAVYVKTGGQLTADASVGMTVTQLQKLWPDMEPMVISYDFGGSFNDSFYGLLTTQISGAPAELYVDLTTQEAQAALRTKNIRLGETSVYEDPWMGQSVSLPGLTVTGAVVRLEQKG